MNKYIFSKEENNKEFKKFGGKAKSFLDLSCYDIEIPKWIVISSDIIIDYLKNENIDLKNIETIKNIIKTFKFPEDFKLELNKKIDTTKMYAVRSSALIEDNKLQSFAGQFDSFLNINKTEIEEHILKVFLSGLTEQIIVYLNSFDINIEDIIPSVIIQEQLNPDAAGVAFSVNPISGNFNECVISAVYGLGNSLVNGNLNADNYIIDKNNFNIEKNISKKEFKEICINNKTELVKIKENLKEQSVLTDEQIKKINELCNSTSLAFNIPQDIEWAIVDNKLYLLQSRPITTLKNIKPTNGILTTWDNSNICESYGGIVAPLTYSFIKKAYSEVYKQMCFMFKVDKNIIEKNQYTFDHMLGYINGRVYYNMISWYKLISILPGYNVNKNFMIQMMGAKEGLSEEGLAIVDKDNTDLGKFKETLKLIKGIKSLLYNNRKIKFYTERFYSNVEEALSNKNLSTMNLEELTLYYREIENKLIRKWDAPVINDFFAMVFYGLLKSLSFKYSSEELGPIYNDLLCGDGQIISTQPPKLIKKIAHNISMEDEDEEIIDILLNGSILEIKIMLHKHQKIEKLINEYIEKFGNRCLEELKLETETLKENPLNLYRSIGAIAYKVNQGNLKEVNEEKIKKEAELKVEKILTNPIKKCIYNYVVNKARYYVRNRENLRFERTRVFGKVREIVNEIGNRMYSFNIIDNPKDIFYLELDEILNYTEGNSTDFNLKNVINLRKEFENEYKKINMPNRFDTRGSVNTSNIIENINNLKNENINDTDIITGTGCCPGLVKGIAKKVTDPKNADLLPGEILIAERTDPGWIMLFPVASAVIVEKGSLLSHASIVTREMGIPSIIGVDNLMNIIDSGDLIEIDGSSGIIKILNKKT